MALKIIFLYQKTSKKRNSFRQLICIVQFEQNTPWNRNWRNIHDCFVLLYCQGDILNDSLSGKLVVWGNNLTVIKPLLNSLEPNDEGPEGMVDKVKGKWEVKDIILILEFVVWETEYVH